MNAARDPQSLLEAHARLNRRHAASRAFWVHDLDAMADAARRLRDALAPLQPTLAFALKANALPAVAQTLRAAGLHADAGSLGELELARAAGFEAAQRTLSGNGRTPEEAAWVAAHGVGSVSADHPDELELLERAAAAHGATLRVSLRVNPGIVAGAHAGLETGHSGTKFGMSRAQALAAWRGRARWPHLDVDGLHLHIGSQILDPAPLLEAARTALALVAESGAAGAPVRRINLGGGFGVDYEGGERAFDARGFARAVAAMPGAGEVAWAFEPGRVLTAAFGTLVAEVLWDKRRDDPDGERRFVVLAAGMNDLIRPALYGARHRIVPLRPRAGAPVRATVVGPVCETSDEFASDLRLPPLETGDPVALLDVGAYGSSMSSNYNGRKSLAEVIRVRGEWRLARPPGSTAAAAAPPAERLPEL